jgi:UDP-N-acetylglucosamine:LPS N-acetylglucosamine transferase
MRLLFVAGALRGGGAERQLNALACAVASLGHEVTVASLDPDIGSHDFRVVPLRRSISGCRWKTAIQLIRACFILRKMANQSRPDAIVTWLALPTAMGVMAFRGSRTPRIVAVRNAVPESMRSIPPIFANRVLRVAFASSGLVVANSQRGLDGYRKLGILAHDRVRVIPNSIDSNSFRPPTTAGLRA